MPFQTNAFLNAIVICFVTRCYITFLSQYGLTMLDAWTAVLS
jgi:hypothetical protein